MKLYYLVRKDLPWPHRAVQLIHAREVFSQAFYERAVRTAVVHVVKDEAALRAVLTRLHPQFDWGSGGGTQKAVSDGGVRTACFFEPDLDRELTAACTDGGPFDLPLL